jgi:alkylated DNA repair dioxygenase AlkB
MTASFDSLDPASFAYTERYLGQQEADAALGRLWRELRWERREITLFGRRMMQPRLIAWYGDPGASYRYSGLAFEPLPWHPWLLEFRRRLENDLGTAFNSVLANAYRDGSDSMGWHSDNEPELGPEPVIASLSLGAERPFRIRPLGSERRKAAPAKRLLPGHGSLLVMRGSSQALYQHALPKTRKPVALRINLTYRYVEPQEAV